VTAHTEDKINQQDGCHQEDAAQNFLAALGVAQRSALQTFLDGIRDPIATAAAQIMNYHVMQFRTL
jgi:hypothetical protein